MPCTASWRCLCPVWQNGAVLAGQHRQSIHAYGETGLEDKKMSEVSVKKEEFGTTPQGEQIYAYTLSNKKGMSVTVLNFGANVNSIRVPDKNGKVEDVVLGFDKLENYYANYSFFGAAVGPIANRTGGAKFTLNGTEYHLDVNDGVNNLHSHLDKAFHKRVWDAQVGEDFVKFTLKEADGSLGLPGNRTVSLVYTLTDDNRIEMHYHMESDRDTVFNMTNHSYFNLKGQGNGKIEDHVLWLKASHFTPVVKGSIPTGEIAPVAGTPMDFTTAHRVGEHIADDYEQINLAGGYDHNWVIDDFDGSLKHFATVEEPESGRIMKAYTNLPGVQFYAGNFIGEEEGKGGALYGKRSGLCLETQFYPDTANKAQFPSATFGPDRIYDYSTVYEFGVK